MLDIEGMSPVGIPLKQGKGYHPRGGEAHVARGYCLKTGENTKYDTESIDVKFLHFYFVYIVFMLNRFFFWKSKF